MLELPSSKLSCSWSRPKMTAPAPAKYPAPGGSGYSRIPGSRRLHLQPNTRLTAAPAPAKYPAPGGSSSSQIPGSLRRLRLRNPGENHFRNNHTAPLIGRVMSCRVMSCRVMSCRVMSCRVEEFLREKKKRPLSNVCEIILMLLFNLAQGLRKC